MTATDRRRTDQQNAAIRTRGISIALSAGAGCGKTFVLTERFLTHIEPNGRSIPDGQVGSDGQIGGDGDHAHGDALNQVVAITFTDRAAREMRDRIRVECSQRLKNCAAHEVDHWLSILRRIDSARISTIHAFCAGFLRRNAVAAGVDPQFGLLEQETGDTLTRRSIARSVRRLLEQEDESCLKLVVHYGLSRTHATLARLLSGHALVDADRFADYDAQQFANEWLDRHSRTFMPGLIMDLVRSPAAAEIVRLFTENECSNATMRKRQSLLLEWFQRAQNDATPPSLESLEEIHAAAKVQGGGNKSCWPNEAIYQAVKAALDKIRERIRDIQKCAAISQADVEQAAELTVAAARVMRSVAADYRSAKESAGLLDFDDLIVRTRDLLVGSQAVREAASNSIAALLVDEFQDTDPMQAEIVRALSGGGVEAGKLFVVGDPKQSIYRFRRADPTVFHAVRESVPAAGRLPLNWNFRSQPAILHFVNMVFAPLLDAYERLEPHREQAAPTPSIEFLFAVPDADVNAQANGAPAGKGDSSPSPDESEVVIPPRAASRSEAADSSEANSSSEGETEEKKEPVRRRRRREAEWIAGRIQELLSDATPRIAEKDRETGKVTLRPVRAGDIAVLFRALSDVAIYEDIFRRRGLAYYLVRGQAFFAQQEIFDLVNLCAFLDDPEDEVSLAGLLRSPFFSLSDETLFALADGGDRSLRNGLEIPAPSYLPETQQEQVRQAARVLSELRRKKDRLPLASLLQLALERTGYDASLLHEFLGRRKVANLRKLIEMARQFDRAGVGTLADFVERLRDSVVEETVEELAATHPETSDVVRLMTVHQSKGLEFPVVIVADLDRPRRGASWEAVYHRELGPLLPLPTFGDEKLHHIALDMSRYFEDREDEIEARRILYVAMTRAADLLILSAGLPPDRHPQKNSWLALLAERFDLATGSPKGDPYFGSTPGAARHAKAAARDEIPEIRVHHQAPRLSAAFLGGTKPAPLSQFGEIVEQGEPAPLPRLMQPVAIRRSARLQVSVSAIEQADALLLGSAANREAVFDSPAAVDSAASRERFDQPDHFVETDQTEAADELRTGQSAGTESDLSNREQAGAVSHPNRPVDWAALDTSPQDPTLLGTVVHSIIERLNGRNRDQIDSLVTTAIKALRPMEQRSLTAAEVKTRIDVFANSELWSDLATARRCFRELDFLLSWPLDAPHAAETAVISGKLDCLLETATGQWKLIDYKTGRVPYADPAAILDHFSIQLLLYSQAVQAMIGRPPDSIEIVVLGEEVRRFPLTLWKEFRTAVAGRIDAAIALLSGPIVPADEIVYSDHATW